MESGKYTLDRYEGHIAVLLLREDESVQVLINKNLLGPSKEGDILKIHFREDGTFENAEILENETSEIRNRANEVLQKLVNKNKL